MARSAAPANQSLALITALQSGDDAALLVAAPRARVGDVRSMLSRGSQKPQVFSVEVLATPPRLGDSLGGPALTSQTVQPVEFSVSAPTALNIDVGFARRGMDTETPGAYITGSGAEIRVGQGLSLKKLASGQEIDHKGWYLFAASDGRALTWTPANDPATPNRGMHLENTVEIGDVQAGVAMNAGPMRTSLSVVKRTVKSYIGPYKHSADDSFAGFTFSWKR
jgi:hypothetical protein